MSQHVVVLGEGTMRGFDDFTANDFKVNLRPLYMRDTDPNQFLSNATFAPLAVLSRPGPDGGLSVARQLVKVVQGTGGDRVADLLEFATVLAAITSSSSSLLRAVKEAEMNDEAIAVLYRHSRSGVALREEGREEGREQMLALFLRDRFGAQGDLVSVAGRLARWPDAASAVHVVDTATSFDEVRRAQPPN